MKSNEQKINVVEIGKPNLELVARGIIIATRTIQSYQSKKKEDKS